MVYRATDGAHVGVVTVHPAEEKYVFIHGPKNPDADWRYDFHHRQGVTAQKRSGEQPGRDGYHRALPQGALRGDSHVHVFSPNGQLVSFTYNDHVLHERDPKLDLRNVGVLRLMAR